MPEVKEVEAKRIRDAEDEVFRRLRAAIGENLVRDGVVDADQYVENELKIVLILKEVNDPGGGGWDLRHFLSKGGRSQSWNNVTRWIRGIQCLPDDLDWSVLEPVGADDRKCLLSKIAVMNLKKIPGGAVSNGGQIYSAASKIRQLLKDQINIYAPDLVICCGTAGIAEALLFEGQSLHWQNTGRGVSYCRLPRKGVLIDFSHPAARCPSNLLIYGLLDAVKEALGYSQSNLDRRGAPTATN